MSGDDYTAGLKRGVEAARELATMGRNCGQHDGGPAALEALADVLEAEIDEEPTDPRGAVICQLCGAARHAPE